MSEQHTIREARQGRTYTGKYGEMVVWLVTLNDAVSDASNGEFELHKKPGNVPQPGDQLEVQRFEKGEAPDGRAFWRIYLVKPGNTSSTSSSGGGSKTYERQPDHPLNMARALHTSALSSTPAFIDQMLTLNAVPQPSTEDEYWALVTRVCGRLKRSYPNAVLQQAVLVSPAQNGAERPQAQSEIPADTADMQPVAVAPDESIPF